MFELLVLLEFQLMILVQFCATWNGENYLHFFSLNYCCRNSRGPRHSILDAQNRKLVVVDVTVGQKNHWRIMKHGTGTLGLL